LSVLSFRKKEEKKRGEEEKRREPQDPGTRGKVISDQISAIRKRRSKDKAPLEAWGTRR
jgi:hypothetical protein